MELDSQLLFNFMPIAITTLAINIALVTIVQRLKRRWRIKVNCWFCNVNTRIYRQENDWWKCPSCEQYNGFSKNGSYNYDIPEQRNASLNNPPRLYSSPNKSHTLIIKNGLCETCNRNEELKLCELRSVDTTKWHDSEIQIFIKNLEEKYPLCKKCNTLVRRVLQKQNIWLIQYKILAFKHKPMKVIVNNLVKLEKLCRIFLTISSAGVIHYPTYEALSVFGAILQLILAKVVSIPRRNFELLLTLVWMCIGILMHFNHSIILRINLKFDWIAIEYITGYHFLTVLSSVLGFINITSKGPATANDNVFFKNLDLPTDYGHSIPEIPNVIKRHVSYENELSKRRTPVNITHLLTTPTSSCKLSSSITSAATSPKFRICDSQRSSFFNFTVNNHQIKREELSPKHSPIEINNSKPCISESLKTLRSLSLSENREKHILKSPKIFGTKMYGTTSSELFRRSYKTTGRKFILAPPKLKSVSQKSWVAGGYWQTGMDTPTLSRSSSQSSGFGSAGSIFGPSREASVVNDIDRCSTMSDATQCCFNTQRQPNISSMNTVCQHTSSSPTCRVIGPEFMSSCMVNSTPNILTNTNSCGPIGLPSVCHSYHINNQCLQNRNMNYNMIQRTPDVLPCVNYPSWVLTNPLLLSALICGSLIFNMVAFCTVLLR